MLLTCWIIICMFQMCAGEFDPCLNHTIMKYVDRRRVANILDTNNIPPINDDALDSGWYRIISEAGEDMPTKPPGLFHCGTIYPIWLNGTLPITVGEQVTENVCLQSYTDVCRLTWSIDIKVCTGNYLVYNLSTSEQAAAGYCFGTYVYVGSSTGLTVNPTIETTNKQFVEFDPCLNHTIMKYADRRAVANILDTIISPINDDALDSGWYRIISEAGEDMPTKPPGLFHCGTNYPIWLNGTLPITVGEQVTENVCLQSYTDVCRLTWSIDIKVCTGNYLVYNLSTSGQAAAGYCFGTYVHVGSSTGLTVKPTIETTNKQFVEFDPCLNHTIMKYADRRAVVNILDTNISPINDDALDSGWYRIISEAGEDMPTKPPGLFHCGTNYPIWLNGMSPTTVGEQVTEKVCLQSYTDVCWLTWNIDIKVCPGNYRVYSLSTSGVVASGYCFGEGRNSVGTKINDDNSKIMSSKDVLIAIIVLAVSVCLLIGIIVIMYCCKKRRRRSSYTNSSNAYCQKWSMSRKTTDSPFESKQKGVTESQHIYDYIRTIITESPCSNKDVSCFNIAKMPSSVRKVPQVHIITLHGSD